MNEPKQSKCCEKCWHINLASLTSINYCSDQDCPCHQNHKDEMDGAIERYEAAKRNGTLDRDFPVIAHLTPHLQWEERFENLPYNGRGYVPDDVMKKFIHSLLQEEREKYNKSDWPKPIIETWERKGAAQERERITKSLEGAILEEKNRQPYSRDYVLALTNAITKIKEGK